MEKISIEAICTNLITKKQIKEHGAVEAQRLLDDGINDPSEYLVFGRRIFEYINAFNKQLESAVRAEVDKNGGLDVNNAKLSLGSTGVRLNYEDDSVYNELKKKLKAREELLKTVHKSGIEIADTSTGEVIPVVSIKTQSKETLIISF